MIEPGAQIHQYKILRRLGAGGMGEVFLAVDQKLKRKVAMKFLSPNLASDSQAEKRMVREAQSAARLDHPNVCTIHEVGEQGNLRFIVFQYIEGETLAARLKRRPIDSREAVRISLQIAAALAEAHSKGILHRDIKPENIMLDERGQVKVLDFGLSKRILTDLEEASAAETASEISMPGVVMGTLPYMSPEQVRGESLNAQTDIFSFGVVLYHMFSGRGPFTAQSKAETIAHILNLDPPDLNTDLPGVNAIVKRCLAKKCEDRYPRMNDVHADLERVLRGGSPSVYPPTDRVAARRRSSKAAAASLLLLLLAGIGVAVWKAGSFSHTQPAAPVTTGISPAYDDYIRGKVKVSSQTAESIDEAIRLLRRAVASDPSFAPAHAELAKAYIAKSFFFSPPDEARLLEDAQISIEKALSLNPNLADAHFARGYLLWTRTRNFPHEMAVRSYKRAIALDPSLDEPHHWLAVVYLHIGLLTKAREEIDQALEINPDNTLARFRYGVIDLYQGNYEASLRELKSIPGDALPALRMRAMAIALFNLSRTAECSSLVDDFLKTYPADEGGAMTSVKAMLLARAGKKEEAEQAIRRAVDIGKNFGHFHHTAYNIAAAYAILNEPQAAMQWLKAAADDGFPCYPYFEIDPSLKNLRADPRFIAFMSEQKKQLEHFASVL